MPNDLSTNYFVGAVAISVLGVTVNQANITHRVFVVFLFILSAVLGIAAILWSYISPHIPAIAAWITLTKKQSSLPQTYLSLFSRKQYLIASHELRHSGAIFLIIIG
jgi:disulfide bond formation protein DsbB